MCDNTYHTVYIYMASPQCELFHEFSSVHKASPQCALLHDSLRQLLA